MIKNCSISPWLQYWIMRHILSPDSCQYINLMSPLKTSLHPVSFKAVLSCHFTKNICDWNCKKLQKLQKVKFSIHFWPKDTMTASTQFTVKSHECLAFKTLSARQFAKQILETLVVFGKSILWSVWCTKWQVKSFFLTTSVSP